MWPRGNTHRASGFTYVAMLFALAVFSVGTATFLQYWSENVRRERERDLLLVGREFAFAIRTYYESSPGTVKQYPKSLEELLSDPRFVGTRRHLRRVYRDPVTSLPQWGIVQAPGGGVMGVFSQGSGTPRKRNGFPPWVQVSGDAGKYSDWKFVYVPTPSS